MTAGFGEEVFFRFGLLSAIFLALERRMSFASAMLVASGATGLAFALLHYVGSDAWSTQLFVTRLLVPGIAFSVAYLIVSPSFVVTAHCTAHIMIPLLFR